MTPPPQQPLLAPIHSIESSVEERLTRLEERIMALCRLVEQESLSDASVSASSTPPPLNKMSFGTRVYEPYPGGCLKLRKRDLERHCLPLFRFHPSPQQSQLLRIVADLETIYPHIDRKSLLSSIRLWFRKKREESSSRINSVISSAAWMEEMIQAVQLSSAASNVPLDGPTIIRQLMMLVGSNRELIMQICKNANIDIQDETAAAGFCLQKIEALLRKRLSMSSILIY